MTQDYLRKEKLLKDLFADFKDELDFDRVNADAIVAEADEQDECNRNTSFEEPYENYLKCALATYLKDWIEAWENE